MSKKQANPAPQQSDDHVAKVPKTPPLTSTIELTQLTRQVTELTEALQRERADAENIRRQHDTQLSGLRQRMTIQVIEALLPVIDNFERSLKYVPGDLEDNAYVKGVQSVVKQFESALSDLGVLRIATVGQPFNPHVHEAVSADGHGEHEVVSEELQAGYQLNEQVIRPAMVKVSRS